MWKTLLSWARNLPFIEAIMSLLEQIGLRGVIFGLISSGAVTAWAWLESKLPYWGLFLVSMGALTFFLGASAVVRFYRNQLKFKPAEYREFGSRLLDLGERIQRFAVQREVRDNLQSERDQVKYENDEDMRRLASSHRERMTENMREFELLFGGEFHVAWFLLKKLGVAMPFPLHPTLNGQYMQHGRFLKFVGRMIAEDKLDEVRNLGPRDLWDLVT